MPKIHPELFRLPDASHLRYAFPGDWGNQYKWFRTKGTKDYRRNLLRPDKKQRPKLGLWNAKNSRLRVVAADFDELPPGMHSFDRLQEAVEGAVGLDSIVTRTPSGKVKAFFTVIEADGGQITADAAKLTLCGILPPELQGFDSRAPALSTAFLTPDMSDALEYLLTDRPVFELQYPSLRHTQGIGGVCSPPDSLVGAPPSPPLRSYTGSIEGFPALMSYCAGSARREAFIRILIASTQLVYANGFAISTKKVASDLRDLGLDAGRLGTIQRSLSDYREELKQLQLLRCISNHYVAGAYGKRYVAEGELRQAILGNCTSKSAPKIVLPSSIEDGCWDHELFRAAKLAVWDEPAFWRWFRSVPGNDLKDRECKAQHAIESRRKYASKARSASVDQSDENCSLTSPGAVGIEEILDALKGVTARKRIETLCLGESL